MPLSAAKKQKRYRDRKKKDDYLGNAYCVTRLMQDAKTLGAEEEMADLLDFAYEIGGEILVERLSFLIYGYTSVAVSVYQQFNESSNQACPDLTQKEG